MSEQRVILGRDELYQLVWTEPVRRVAKRHGISDVALAKACRKMRIPLPNRGHWAKVAAGHKVRRAALPPIKDGQPSQYRSRVYATTLTPEVAMTLEKELASEQLIRVADELVAAHPLVAEAATVLAKAKPNKEGLVSRRDRRCLDIRVSPALLNRALRIIDAVLKALEQRGFKIEATVPRKEEREDYYGRVEHVEHPTQTTVQIGKEVIAFGLREETEFTYPPAKRPPRDADYKTWSAWRDRPLPPRRTTGALTLSMNDVHGVGRKKWTDGKRRLEDCLNSFVRALVGAGAILAARQREAEERAQRWKEQQEQWTREEKARKVVAERIAWLDKQLASWQTARDIRTFVGEARALLACSNVEATHEMDEYLTWVLARADELDPLRELRMKAGADMAKESSAMDSDSLRQSSAESVS